MPIDFFLLDWLNLLLRWAHIITGIAWIGSSFYFIWLDQRLNVPPRDPENTDVAGDLWAVHGGGFYHSQKYKVAPAELPRALDPEMARRIAEAVKPLGFRWVALDLEGYRTGSLNEVLAIRSEPGA